MEYSVLEIPGVVLIKPQSYGDDRGFFLESYHAPRYRDIGLNLPFVQDNHSRSQQGVLRGLHYQLAHPQGKLVSVVRGAVFDVAVDIRRGSPSFGRWVSAELNDENHHQLYVPPGFAHGFCTLSPVADLLYKCTDYYDAQDDRGIAWNDADIGIRWPRVDESLLSGKDRKLPKLSDATDQLPIYLRSAG